jgi:SET domain-containing protein
MNLLDGTILDCKNTDCFAKYANDASGFSKSDFKNNAKIALAENNNVCLIAIRKIKSGEEIFCDYGKKYWKKHS